MIIKQKPAEWLNNEFTWIETQTESELVCVCVCEMKWKERKSRKENNNANPFDLTELSAYLRSIHSLILSSLSLPLSPISIFLQTTHLLYYAYQRVTFHVCWAFSLILGEPPAKCLHRNWNQHTNTHTNTAQKSPHNEWKPNGWERTFSRFAVSIQPCLSLCGPIMLKALLLLYSHAHSSHFIWFNMKCIGFGSNDVHTMTFHLFLCLLFLFTGQDMDHEKKCAFFSYLFFVFGCVVCVHVSVRPSRLWENPK